MYLSMEIKSTSIVNKKSKPINVFRFEIYWNFDNNTHTHTHTQREREKATETETGTETKSRHSDCHRIVCVVSRRIHHCVKWKNDSSKLNKKLYQTRFALVSPRER